MPRSKGTATPALTAPRRIALSKLGKTNAGSIYQRADGGLEVGYRDESGKQRWKAIDGGITSARAFRDEMKSRKNRGETTGVARLRLGEAGAAWLDGPVSALRERTQRTYGDNFRLHVEPVFGAMRMDRITPDALAKFVRDLRRTGKSENTITGILGVVNGIYRYAARSLNYKGSIPTGIMLPAERPKAKNKTKRKLFTSDELESVIAAAREVGKAKRYTAPWASLFITAMYTAGRVSEVIGLVWDDLDIDSSQPTVSYEFQLDARGNREPLKTEDSIRKLPLPDAVAAELRAHRARSAHTRGNDFVFATRTGQAVSKRNTSRALRLILKNATKKNGEPVHPILHETVEGPDGEPVPVKVPRGALPSMHSFRHTYASLSLARGESVDDIAPMLGHANGTVTRQVYIHDVKDAQREAARRERANSLYGSILEASDDAIEEPVRELAGQIDL